MYIETILLGIPIFGLFISLWNYYFLVGEGESALVELAPTMVP
jgi:hypothetical protein